MPKQLPHLVFGGELESPEGPVVFKDLKKIDFIGLFPNYAEAHKAWQAAARRTMDDARIRYFIVHLHRLLDPSQPDQDRH